MDIGVFWSKNKDDFINTDLDVTQSVILIFKTINHKEIQYLLTQQHQFHK